MDKQKLLAEPQPLFVTGIGTDVGKTVVSALLCQWLKANYWKPIQSGDPEGGDSKTIRKLVSHDGFQIFKEHYKFDTPISPHAAAKIEGREIALNSISLPPSKRPLIIEGAGGLLVPLNYQNETICDLILHLKASVIVVVKEYLGNINHTLLTIAHLRSQNINIAGFVFVGKELPHTWDIVSKTTGLPLLFRVPIFPKLDRSTICNFTKKIS